MSEDSSVDSLGNRSIEGSEDRTVGAYVEGEGDLRLRRLVTMWGLERSGREDFKGREKATK